MTHVIFREGVSVKITYAGDHCGKEGTVSRIVPRARTADLIYVTVPGVDRDLMFYPGDLEVESC
jgi:hypothetical protein